MSAPTNGTDRTSTPTVEEGKWSWSVASARNDVHRPASSPRLHQAAIEDAAEFFAEEVARGRFCNQSFDDWLRRAQAAAVGGAIEAWNARPEVVPADAPRRR